jgi:adenylosuccinate lyase
MARDLTDTWEVLGEAVQTVLRAAGIPGGYEKLKEFTRARAVDQSAFHAFIEGLPLSVEDKARLRDLTPNGYTGLAAELARRV